MAIQDASHTLRGSFLQAGPPFLPAGVGTTSPGTQTRLSATIDSSSSPESANTPSNPLASPLSAQSDSEFSQVSEGLIGFENQARVCGALARVHLHDRVLGPNKMQSPGKPIVYITTILVRCPSRAPRLP